MFDTTCNAQAGDPCLDRSLPPAHDPTAPPLGPRSFASPSPHVSVAVPVFNEVDNLEELYRRLAATLDATGHSWEIVVVDDGSRDGTFAVLDRLSGEDPRVCAVRLSRNFGHHVAVTAALDFARGEVVVLMDGDLQHRPEDIPRFLEALEGGGYDTVAGIPRKQRVSWFKRVSSQAYNRLLRGMVRDPIAIDSNIYRVMRRKVVRSFRECRERSRYVTGLLAWVGYRRGEIPIELDCRHAGQSKYNLGRMLRLATHSITAFSSFPLDIATYVGFGVSFSSLAYGLYLAARKIVLNTAVEGWTSIVCAVYFMGGVQMMMLGILGTYLGRVYTEVQGRPLYVVDEARNLVTTPAPGESERPMTGRQEWT